MSRKQPPPDMEYETTELPTDAAHWRVAFDSRFLRHYWLNGKPRVVTIVDVKQLKSSSDSAKETKSQLLIFLKEAEKPWAANVTNCDLIETALGTGNPREWIGKQVELYPTKTRFGRELVDCMRVREQAPKQTQERKKPPQRIEVTRYLQQMKTSDNLDQLIDIASAIAEDNTLTAEETQLLETALVKRKDQVTAAPVGVAT